MDKKLLEEISRQKELMSLNEQGLAQSIFGGVTGSMGKAIAKSFLDAAFDKDDDEVSLDKFTSDKDIEKSYSSDGGKSTDFEKEVNRVIDNFEGGYYHPDMNQSDMGKSGETMMGMDRKHGVGFTKTQAGQEFWKLIDDANARKNWKWNYKGGPLEGRLRKLVVKMIQPEYERLSSRYLNEKAREIVKKSPNLLFHFIYATWNGSGWFQKFANKINEAVNKGITNISELESIAMKSRKESGNRIVASGGQKMTKLLGIKNV
jgi:hypothetical protein